LAASVADMAFTMAHFLPINRYFGGTALDPVLLKQYANSWVTANYFRMMIDINGLYTSARTLHRSYVSA